MSGWVRFPFGGDHAFDDARLRACWSALHACDGLAEPPQAERAGWALFHAGAFDRAVACGGSLAGGGDYLMQRATLTYATLLEPRETTRLMLLQQAAVQAHDWCERAPGDANAWWSLGEALHQYAHGINVARALAQGLCTRSRAALERALALAPQHGLAHLSLGGLHAHVIDKVGRRVAEMTYASHAETAFGHLRAALRIMPDAPAARLGYADALVMIDGAAALPEATRLYAETAGLTPLDAEQRLGVELARAAGV